MNAPRQPGRVATGTGSQSSRPPVELDPYREWLHIAEDRRPPNHYDLLGLDAFEADAERIRAAGLSRTAEVRRFQVGPHSETAIRVMGELAAAFTCLRDARRKAEYDAQLRGGETLVDTGAGEPQVADATPPAIDKPGLIQAAPGASGGEPAQPSAPDPYFEWLRIPLDRRPPTYYDLFGLRQGEPDVARIRQAAAERIARVRAHQIGEHDVSATTLLAELLQALDCLCDPNRKLSYDNQTSSTVAPVEPATAGEATATEVPTLPPQAQESLAATEAASPFALPAATAPRAPIGARLMATMAGLTRKLVRLCLLPFKRLPWVAGARWSMNKLAAAGAWLARKLFAGLVRIAKKLAGAPAWLFRRCIYTVISLPRWLDGLLAFFAGGADNRILHNFLRFMFLIVGLGGGWLGWQWWLSLPASPRAPHRALASVGDLPPAEGPLNRLAPEGMLCALRPLAAPGDYRLDSTTARGAWYQDGLIYWTPPPGSAGQTFEFTIVSQGIAPPPVAATPDGMDGAAAADPAAASEDSPAPAAEAQPEPVTIEVVEAIVIPGALTGLEGMQFRCLPAGSFQQGASADDPLASADEMPQRQVEISRPFYLGICEVTQAQWRAVMDEDPTPLADRAQAPAEQVTWYRAVEFCNRLSLAEGLIPCYAGDPPEIRIVVGGGYRLPTEAEWEYACRAGSPGSWTFGDDEGLLGQFAWFLPNSGGAAKPVGHKRPNAWGLFDMHGNVGEWCQDGYDPGAYALGGARDPAVPPTGPLRVARGGDFNRADGPSLCSARRYALSPDVASPDLGFRVARDAPSSGP